MNTILYQNQPICKLRTEESKAIVQLAPYWGLQFEQHQLAIKPSLSSKTVCIKNVNHSEQTHLQDILSHTGIHLMKEDGDCDLFVQMHRKIEKHSTSIVLLIDNIKYRLKFAHHIGQNLQRIIHRNIWLPVRSPSITLTFYDMTEEERIEVFSYLIIQYFLREQMIPISHLSLQLYSSLIEKVLYPINPSFASLQEKNHQTIWPEIPPEIKQHPNKSDQISENRQNSSIFNPFKNHSSNMQKKVNPFLTNKKKNSSTINPFKKP